VRRRKEVVDELVWVDDEVEWVARSKGVEIRE
jgi:hypothetical protein